MLNRIRTMVEGQKATDAPLTEELGVTPGSGGSARRWMFSAALVGLIAIMATGFSGNWANSASGDTGGTGPAHSFTFTPAEITLDPVNDSTQVIVSLDGLDASVVANTVQVTIVHDDLVHEISAPSCIGLYAGAGVGTIRVGSENATSIVCTTGTAPTDDDLDGIIAGDVIQFTITRKALGGDATLSLLGTGPWNTDVIENGSFVGSPALGSLSVLNNHAPTASPQSLTLLEDGSLLIVLAGADDNGDPLTFQVTGAGPLNGSLTGVAPNVTYSPDPDFNGADSFTFTADDSVLPSTEATVSLTIDPVNDQPSFASAGNQSVFQDVDAPQTVPNWATSISAGPTNESGQILTFSVTNNTAPSLFTVGPAVDSSGELTFTHDISQSGIATITVQLSDDGGTDDGGVDSVSIQFDIEIVETRQISGAAGTVTVDGGIDISLLIPQVSVIDSGDQTIQQVPVSPDGSFVITSVPVGTYTLKIELLGFQVGTATGLIVNGGDVVMDAITISGGFVNTDADVNGADLTLILAAFGTDSGDITNRVDTGGSVVDFTGDDEVTGLDVDLVGRNVGSVEVEVWSPVAP